MMPKTRLHPRSAPSHHPGDPTPPAKIASNPGYFFQFEAEIFIFSAKIFIFSAYFSKISAKIFIFSACFLEISAKIFIFSACFLEISASFWVFLACFFEKQTEILEKQVCFGKSPAFFTLWPNRFLNALNSSWKISPV